MKIPSRAKLKFFYGSMNAGKSMALLQTRFNYIERGLKVEVFTSSIADRDGHAIVSSRIGISCPAKVYTTETNFVTEFCKFPLDTVIVLIEEAQFLTTEQVHELCRIVDSCGISVYCYGLRTNFVGQLFRGSSALFAFADEFVELPCICSSGDPATFNMRIDARGNPVVSGKSVKIGGNEGYVSVSRKTFFSKVFDHPEFNAIEIQ